VTRGRFACHILFQEDGIKDVTGTRCQGDEMSRGRDVKGTRCQGDASFVIYFRGKFVCDGDDSFVTN
jgi:hypothetical protein